MWELRLPGRYGLAEYQRIKHSVGLIEYIEEMTKCGKAEELSDLKSKLKKL